MVMLGPSSAASTGTANNQSPSFVTAAEVDDGTLVSVGVSVDTHCPYCALQCGMSLTADAGHWVVAGRDFPVNRGALCRKGWTSAELLDAPDRLLTPLVRRTRAEPLLPATWEDAVAFVVDKIQGLAAAHGPDAIGIFGGGGLTNETAYMLGKFARVVLRSKHIDYPGAIGSN